MHHLKLTVTKRVDLNIINTYSLTLYLIVFVINACCTVLSLYIVGTSQYKFCEHFLLKLQRVSELTVIDRYTILTKNVKQLQTTICMIVCSLKADYCYCALIYINANGERGRFISRDTLLFFQRCLLFRLNIKKRFLFEFRYNSSSLSKRFLRRKHLYFTV